MPQLVSSMLRRLELGNALRRLREERHMTIADVTAAMKERFGSSFSTAKLSRMETAKRGVIPRDVHDLCDLYGVPDEVREQLMELAKEAREQDELADQPELRGLSRYSAVERVSTHAREYSSMYVPGLLQTPAYALHVESFATTWPELYDWVEGSKDPHELVAARLRRQELLEDPQGLELHMILDENVLRRRLADPAVMLEQLRHLATASRRGNIKIQIIPLSVGLYPGSETTMWSILEYPSSDGNPAAMAFTEGLFGGRILEREGDLNRLATAFGALISLALDAEASRALIEKIIAEYDT